MSQLQQTICRRETLILNTGNSIIESITHARKLLFLILFAFAFAGCSNDGERQARAEAEEARKAAEQQRQVAEHWQRIAWIGGIGAAVLLIVGTALGSAARKDAEASKRKKSANN